MKKILPLLLLVSSVAFGQSYPSPTYNNLTVNGTATIPYKSALSGGVARTVQSKLQDYVVAQDFGVKCDNSTNNTTALGNALSAAQNAQKPLYIVGAGTCLTDWINYGSVPIANQVSIYSDGATLQKITSDGNPVMTIGSATGTNYIGPIVVRGLTFSGVSGSSSAALAMYDVVRSSFEDDTFENAIVGLYSYGGISNDYRNDIFSANQIGFRGDTFSSLAGGGVPNLFTFDGSKFVNNSTWGIYYNGGNDLLVRNFDIEGNGTNGTSASGGAYIAAVSTGYGATFDGGWFEANAGGQNLWLNGGNSDVHAAMFIASPNATNDINITAGRYSLRNVVCVNSKTANINETGSSAGNTIDDTFCPNLNWNQANTKLFTPSFSSINGSLTVTGSISPSAGLKLPVSTVAALPTCNTAAKGLMYAVSDATAPTYNATLTGSGAVSVPVYCNGSAWTSH